MTHQFSGERALRRFLVALAAALLAFAATSCTVAQRPVSRDAERLRETASLVEDVKAFGKTLGIEPTEALSRTSQNGPALSMLWLWMQRDGTLALNTPIDIRMAVGFATPRNQLKLEQVYRVDGYSVYYRQGSEFADARSLATVGFADEPVVRRVEVILHEDLHGDKNFDLPWELEESIVTPFGSVAALEYFRFKGDSEAASKALAAIQEFRTLSRELNSLTAEAKRIFKTETPDKAKEKILELMKSYPTYQKGFERQIRGQHPATVLEAKLSHDLAYYKHYDAIVSLYEKCHDLKLLIADLKGLAHDATGAALDELIQQLNVKYGAPAP
jgi:hypothetical protein